MSASRAKARRIPPAGIIRPGGSTSLDTAPARPDTGTAPGARRRFCHATPHLPEDRCRRHGPGWPLAQPTPASQPEPARAAEPAGRKWNVLVVVSDTLRIAY